MTEETKDTNIEVSTEQKQETVELSPVEQKAYDEGWRPKDDWNGDPDDWKDAKTYIRDGELFKKIDAIKQENRNLKKSVTALKTHYERVKETEYKRALEELKARKKEALREGDGETAVAIEERIEEVVEDMQQAQQVSQAIQVEPEVHPEFAQWVDKNKWYNDNNELREFADSIGVAHKKAHPSASPREVLDYVEGRVTKAYPEMFKNQRKNAPSTVEGGTGPRKTSNSGVVLTPDEERVMRRLVGSGLLTEEKYKADILALEKQGKR